MLGNPAVREVFMRHHANLLDIEFWQTHKERIARGEVLDVFPYEQEKRFHRHAEHAAGIKAPKMQESRLFDDVV